MKWEKHVLHVLHGQKQRPKQRRSDGTLNWNALTFDAFVLKSAYPFCIGQDGTGRYGCTYNGFIDDFALWTRTLSHDDVKRIYEAGRKGLALGDCCRLTWENVNLERQVIQVIPEKTKKHMHGRPVTIPILKELTGRARSPSAPPLPSARIHR